MTKYREGDFLGPNKTLFIKRFPNRRGLFKCSLCGKEFETRISSVVKGITKSCGCYRRKIAKERGHKNGAINGATCTKNYLGQTIGELTFIEKTNRRRSGNVI